MRRVTLTLTLTLTPEPTPNPDTQVRWCGRYVAEARLWGAVLLVRGCAAPRPSYPLALTSALTLTLSLTRCAAPRPSYLLIEAAASARLLVVRLGVLTLALTFGPKPTP